MCLVAACGTADAAQTPPDAHALLDVPYMAQPPALCGGAAVAMVLRYWGRSDVYPQDFASLVSDADGGIFTHTLASAVRDRHWDASPEWSSDSQYLSLTFQKSVIKREVVILEIP
jgi:hypothetical protein